MIPAALVVPIDTYDWFLLLPIVSDTLFCTFEPVLKKSFGSKPVYSEVPCSPQERISPGRLG